MVVVMMMMMMVMTMMMVYVSDKSLGFGVGREFELVLDSIQLGGGSGGSGGIGEWCMCIVYKVEGEDGGWMDGLEAGWLGWLGFDKQSDVAWKIIGIRASG